MCWQRFCSRHRMPSSRSMGTGSSCSPARQSGCCSVSIRTKWSAATSRCWCRRRFGPSTSSTGGCLHRLPRRVRWVWASSSQVGGATEACSRSTSASSRSQSVTAGSSGRSCAMPPISVVRRQGCKRSTRSPSACLAASRARPHWGWSRAAHAAWSRPRRVGWSYRLVRTALSSAPVMEREPDLSSVSRSRPRRASRSGR